MLTKYILMNTHEKYFESIISKTIHIHNRAKLRNNVHEFCICALFCIFYRFILLLWPMNYDLFVKHILCLAQTW